MSLMKYVLEQDVTRLPSVTEELFGDFKEIAQEVMESSNMWNEMDLWSTHRWNFVFENMLFLKMTFLLNKANIANKCFSQVTLQQSLANEKAFSEFLD